MLEISPLFARFLYAEHVSSSSESGYTFFTTFYYFGCITACDKFWLLTYDLSSP